MKNKFKVNQLKQLGIFVLTLSLVGNVVNFNLMTDIHANNDKKDNPEVRNAIEESVDLEDSFKLSGIATDFHGNNYKEIDNDSSYYSITKGKTEGNYQTKYNNKIILGKKDPVHTRQSIALTSQYSIDFKRKFQLKGKVNLSSVPDGFAVGFHTNNNYKNRNAGGSLGVYSEPTYNHANNPGIPNAIVFEVDTFNNYVWSEDDSKPYENPFNDNVTGDTDKGEKGKHIAINLTDDKGIIVNKDRNNYPLPDSFLNKDNDFIINWEPTINEFKVTIGNITIKRNVGATGDFLKQNPVYYTVSNVLFLGDNDVSHGDLNARNSIELYSYKYTDFEPKIETAVEIHNSSKNYAIAGDDVIVTHKISNNSNSTAELNDFLNYGNFSYGGYIFDSKNINNIKVGSDLNSLEKYNGQFDASHPIPVKYNTKNQPYYVQYNITITDRKNYGNFDKLVYHVRLGTKGMTELHSFGDILVKNAPALFAERNNNKMNVYDIGYLNSSRDKEALLNMLWNSIYFKTDNDNTRIKLLKEQKNYQNITINWKYNKNLNPLGIQDEKLESLLKSENLKKSDVFSIDLEAVDNTDNRLKKSFRKYVVIADHLNNGISDPSGYTSYIFASNLSDITETELVKKDKASFIDYVKKDSNAKGLKVNGITGLANLVEQVNVDITGWINSKGNAIKKPGNHQISVNLNENRNVKVETNLKITSNVLSSYKFDNKGNIIKLDPNGINGFIAIPSVINLKNSDKQITGDAKVYFVNYSVEDETKFDLFVDKTFVITNNKNNSSITMNSSSTNGENIESGNNKLKIGTIDSSRGFENPFNIRFTASNQQTLGVKGIWNGQVSFHINRK